MRSKTLALSVVMASLALAFNASAAKIPFETTGFIHGQHGIHKNLNIKIEGDYQATLSDLSFGGLKFDYLGMSIGTAKANLATLEGTGSLNLKMAPGIYFLNIFGKAGGIYNTGLYGIAVHHAPVIANTLSAPGTPVPLPAASWLLLSGLAALGLRARKR